MITREVLEAFDGFLSDRSLVFEGVVIGGAALILMELVRRATDDVDCLHPQIPAAIQVAALDFAGSAAASDFSLRKNWFNNGPASLTRDLPPGWLERTCPLFTGRALRLTTLGRLDLLRSKLFAFCDRQEDLDDCIALRPTSEELAEIEPWLLERDASPLWPEHVRRSLAALQQELQRGFESRP